MRVRPRKRAAPAPAAEPGEGAEAAAKVRDLALYQARRKNTRSSAMIAMAALGLVACILAAVFLAVYGHTDNQTGGLILGLLTSIAAAFGGCLQQAFSFEFGSSKGGADTQDHMAAVTTQALSHLSDMGQNTVPTSALGSIQGASPPQKGTAP